MLYFIKNISQVLPKNVRGRTATTPRAIHPMKIVYISSERGCCTVYAALMINYLLYHFFKKNVPIVYAAKITENRILVIIQNIHSSMHKLSTEESDNYLEEYSIS